MSTHSPENSCKDHEYYCHDTKKCLPKPADDGDKDVVEDDVGRKTYLNRDLVDKEKRLAATTPDDRGWVDARFYDLAMQFENQLQHTGEYKKVKKYMYETLQKAGHEPIPQHTDDT